jgi:uncharacterized protein YprB with RNaseH-like and TPR domain
VFDIETSYNRANIWNTGEQYIGFDQITEEWRVISWAAKWLGEKKVFQQDLRKTRNKQDDRKLVKGIWKLLDQADVVITQNGKKFDVKKLNARFVELGLESPSSYRHIDVYRESKKHFSFISHSLESLCKRLKVKFQKLKHSKFPGRSLWDECLAGNQVAWKEMAKYNIYDILALECVYEKIQAWQTSVIITLDGSCNCGANNWKKYGFRYTNTKTYQRLKCGSCGAEKKGELA